MWRLVWVSLCRKTRRQVFSQRGPNYNIGFQTYYTGDHSKFESARICLSYLWHVLPFWCIHVLICMIKFQRVQNVWPWHRFVMQHCKIRAMVQKLSQREYTFFFANPCLFMMHPRVNFHDTTLKGSQYMAWTKFCTVGFQTKGNHSNLRQVLFFRSFMT